MKKIKYLISQYGPWFLIAFCIAWLLTNGWAYIMLGLGLLFNNGILLAISGGYLAFLWLPFTPEKILTLAISIWLVKILTIHNKEI